jgi:tetratricopeptide (TPR) repeat protein
VTNLAYRQDDTPEMDSNRVFRAGLVQLQSNQIKEAIVAFEQALELAPDDPFCLSYLGLSMALIRRRAKQAVSYCERAVQMESSYPELWHNLGRVYLMSGNRKRGREMLLKGLDVDPGNEDIQDTLRSIGIRRKPPLPFLPRHNPINIVLGRTLRKLKIR